MKVICDKANQFRGCVGCTGSIPHEKTNDCCVEGDEIYFCQRCMDSEQKEKVPVMCVEIKEDLEEQPIQQHEIDKLIEQERQAQIDYEIEQENKKVTPYQMTINNCVAFLKREINKNPNKPPEINSFQMSEVLAIAFCMDKEKVMNDLLYGF